MPARPFFFQAQPIRFAFAAVAAVLLCLASFQPAAAAPAPVAATTGFVEVPGGKLWYEARGEGMPVVFLHDGLLSSAVWDGSFPDFARRFRAVRYDRRGYGQSAPPQGTFSDLDDLQAVLKTLKIDRALLVGSSSGARIAVDFTLAYPDRVEGLVLVGPVVSGLPHSDHFLRRNLIHFGPAFLEKNVAGTVESWVRDSYLTDPANTAAREKLRQLLTSAPAPATGNVAGGSEPERPAADRLSEIRRPTLILVGASDIPDVHAHAGALAAGIRRARRVVIPGAGHLVPLEQPQAFFEEVFTFASPGDAARAYLRSLDGKRFREEGRRLLQYDASAPLDVKEAGTEQRGDVRVVDLSYASPAGGRVPAYLVLPPGEGKHPAAVFVHPGQGDRTTFLDEAVDLAGRGLVSLLLSAPDRRPEYQNRPPLSFWDPVMGQQEQAQVILDARRGFDLLATRPEVDTARLAYVGHSLGATIGGALAAVEKRPVGYVLMAGLPSLTHAYSEGTGQGAAAFDALIPPDQQARYVAALSPLDAVHHIGEAAPARLLFQFAHRDEFISYWDAALYLEAASSPKEVQWFDTDHYFNEEARARRGEWLSKLLGLKPGKS